MLLDPRRLFGRKKGSGQLLRFRLGQRPGILPLQGIQLPVHPHQGGGIGPKVKIAGPHLHRRLQIGPHHAWILLAPPAGLADEFPQGFDMLLRQKLLLLHQIQGRHRRVGREYHPHLIGLFVRDPTLFQAGGQHVIVERGTHDSTPKASPFRLRRATGTIPFASRPREESLRLMP